MNLREEIIKSRSKTQVERIVDWIGTNRSRMRQLVNLVQEDQDPLPLRSSWILTHCIDAHPSLIYPHLQTLISLAEKSSHTSVRRHIVRSLSQTELPEDAEGRVFDICLKFTRRAKEDIAVRVHALTVVSNIALKYPELRTEVIELLTGLRDHDSAAIRSRVRKMLSMLNKSKSI